MGGKDVIYMKQKHASSLQAADVQKKLKAIADKRFLDSDEQYVIDSQHISPNDKVISYYFVLRYLLLFFRKYNYKNICIAIYGKFF